MDTVALEKDAKAKRIAEAILVHLELWLEAVTKGQNREKPYYDGRMKAADLTPNTLNRLAEQFTEIIEREL